MAIWEVAGFSSLSYLLTAVCEYDSRSYLYHWCFHMSCCKLQSELDNSYLIRVLFHLLLFLSFLQALT